MPLLGVDFCRVEWSSELPEMKGNRGWRSIEGHGFKQIPGRVGVAAIWPPTHGLLTYFFLAFF